MNRKISLYVVIAAVLTALLAACERTPLGGDLAIDVTPENARVTVVREIDDTLVYEGYGDVTLTGLQPGTYVVTTGEGDDLVVQLFTVRTRERTRATLETMARNGGNGGGGGGNGGGGGGKGDSYADLMLLYRDVNGVPLTNGPWEGEHGTSYCVQPITTDEVPNPYYLLDGDEPQYLEPVVNPVDGRTVTLVPLFAHYPEFLPEDEDISGALTPAARPTDPGPPDDHEDEGGEPCDPLVITLQDGTTFNYAAFTKEVELERLNLARSPEHVLRQHMREVQALIEATEPDRFTLDPAGRPVFDGVAIDAMPKLQGMRESLLETGTLPGASEHPEYPFPFQLANPDFSQWSTWELSSFTLGGAASKFATINVDAVAYHDRIMGIADDWVPAEGWPKNTLYSPELNESFVDYSDFTYDRSDTFPGCVVYLDAANWSAGFQAARLLDVVEFSEPTPKQDNLAGYTQMAEDARAIIYFIHENESGMAYADPVGMDSWDACVALSDELNAE